MTILKAPFGNRNIGLSRGSRVGAATTLARSVGRRGGTGLPFSGHIYSLIVHGRTTNVNTIAFIEKYLVRNAGLIL
jgi:hypothetical protein